MHSEATTSSQIGILHPCTAAIISGEHGSTQEALDHRTYGGPRDGCEVVARETERSRIMNLIQVVEVLVVVGVLLWLVNRFIPMQSSIKSILNGVVVIAVVLWLLNTFGLFHSLSRVRVGS